jgi:hypothetical protein
MEKLENEDYCQIEKEFDDIFPENFYNKSTLTLNNSEEITPYRELFKGERSMPEQAEVYEDGLKNTIMKIDYDGFEIYLKGMMDGQSTLVNAIVRSEGLFFVMVLFGKEDMRNQVKMVYGDNGLEMLLKEVFLRNKKEQE